MTDQNYAEIVKKVETFKPDIEKLLKIYQSDEYTFGRMIDDYNMDLIDTERKNIIKK